MSLKPGIRRFLSDIDPVILARGEDYYRSGRVESVVWEENHAAAEVSGSEEEPYLAELDFSDSGEVEDWSCSCPYEWGPVCKHIAAALLAIQAKPPEKAQKKAAGKKPDIRALVEKASKEQLAALVLEHCQEDKRFQSQAVFELSTSKEQELAAVQALIEASIQANKHRGYIDMRGCDSICADLDGVLDKARSRIDCGQYAQAVDMTLFVLLTAVKLAGTADGSSGSLGWTVDAAMETAELAAAGLVRDGGPRGELVEKILKTAENSAFDGWDHWRYDLLCRAAVLADTENEGRFYHFLDRLSDKLWEKFQDSPKYGYEEEDKLTRYRVMRSARGAEAARGYLEQNLEVDDLRMILVREDMAKGDYANAERLCRERAEKEQAGHWYRPGQWQYLLYEIYRDWGRREEQINQARRLALLGDRDFYQTAKNLLTEAGRWREAYPGFLAELKASRPVYEYMELLKQEGETALLMEQVRLYPKTVFQYGGVLAQAYGKEIFALCAAMIRECAEQSGSRKEYQRLCALIASLAEFGGRAEARALLAELRHVYPHRRALLDELARTERAMEERRGR